MVDSYFHGNPQRKQIYWESTISNFHANPLLQCDEETGYSYFGVRYYNSDLSIWLSVDPMSGHEKEDKSGIEAMEQAKRYKMNKYGN